MSHHDDHTWDWGFSGFIAKLADAGWTGYFVRATNDEKDSSIGEHGEGWAKGDIINLKESRDAARILGLKDVLSLNWRNDHMDSIPLRELRAQHILLLRKFRPEIVMTYDPWGQYDRNPDHRKVSRSMGEALWMAGLANVHPEHFELGLKPWRVPHVFYGFRANYGKGHEVNAAVAITAEHVRRKTSAHFAHKNVYGGGADPLLEKDARWIGAMAGVEFAEKYYYRGEFDHLPGLKEYLLK